MTPEVKVYIDQDFCKGCGICVAACPQKILSLSHQLNAFGYRVVAVDKNTVCKGCLRCAVVCPEAAFTLTREDDAHANNDER